MHLFKDEVISMVEKFSSDADISIIEGNHGLFDSIDREGTGSSAYLARHLTTPVILIVNCNKMSRSVAALINGFTTFESETNIAGVILNQISGKRHEAKIVEAINKYCSIPVLGVVYKTNNVTLEQRHIGIITTEDKSDAAKAVADLKKIAEQSINLDKIIEIANSAEKLPASTIKPHNLIPNEKNKVTIAVARDNAFNFYYIDNLQALEQYGARLVFFSPLNDEKLPSADGLYIGGGYPEIYAKDLEKNKSMKDSICEFINAEYPVFAECGGLMYMAEKIIWQNQEHKMLGLVKADCIMHNEPQGRGYVELATIPENHSSKSVWKIPPGELIRAHEFHYSSLANLPGSARFFFSMTRGTGILNKHDGLLYKNMLATYTHFHSRAAHWWAPAFVEACQTRKIQSG